MLVRIEDGAERWLLRLAGVPTQVIYRDSLIITVLGKREKKSMVLPKSRIREQESRVRRMEFRLARRVADE